MKLHFHMIHLERQHKIKLAITAGCVASAIVAALFPQYNAHATVIAVATNVVWIWA